jgi:hypothetical protein
MISSTRVRSTWNPTSRQRSLQLLPSISTEAEFLNVPYNFVEVSGHNRESSQT